MWELPNPVQSVPDPLSCCTGPEQVTEPNGKGRNNLQKIPHASTVSTGLLAARGEPNLHVSQDRSPISPHLSSRSQLRKLVPASRLFRTTQKSGVEMKNYAVYVMGEEDFDFDRHPS